MSRWDISNNVEYDGINVARRDLLVSCKLSIKK